MYICFYDLRNCVCCHFYTFYNCLLYNCDIAGYTKIDKNNVNGAKKTT